MRLAPKNPVPGRIFTLCYARRADSTHFRSETITCPAGCSPLRRTRSRRDCWRSRWRSCSPWRASSRRPSRAPTMPTQQSDPRLFAQTGYRIDRDSFWDYFTSRGGVTTFGYPASRDFQFLGCTSQFFQRVVMQQCGAQGVGTLNLLDDGLLAYTMINGSTFPAVDTTLKAATPRVTDPNYASAILRFVAQQRAGHLRWPAGQFPPDVQHDAGRGGRGHRRSSHAGSARARGLGRSDQQASLRPRQSQLHLSALPARHHALRQDVRLHAGSAARRLPEGAADGRGPAARSGDPGGRQLAVVRGHARRPGARRHRVRQRLRARAREREQARDAAPAAAAEPGAGCPSRATPNAPPQARVRVPTSA